MRKVALVIILGFAMLACSVSDINNLIPANPTVAAPTDAGTPSDTPTITPTQPTPTFTTTPTLFSSGSVSTSTLTPIPTSTLWIMNSGLGVQNLNPKTTPEPYGFSSYQIGGNVLYRGNCQPNSLQVIAKPSDIIRTHYVLLFLRLQDKTSPTYTAWGSGAIMDSNGKGTFYYTLTAQNLPEYQDFDLAWIQYQFVATDNKLDLDTKNFHVIGRTKVVLTGLTYSRCP
jgi:hypothetical protein